MAYSKKIPGEVVNPFSEAFLDTWDLYKAYRVEVHNFRFKGVISEQMQLKKLVELSGGDEQLAVRIVEQTISSGKWMGFYPLHQPKYKENGTAKQSTSKKQPEPKQSLREQAADELMRRNANGGQQGNGDHLKAV